MVTIETQIDYIFGAHRTVRVNTGILKNVKQALQKLTTDEYLFDKSDGNQLFISIDGIDFVTAAPVIEVKQGDISKGGSGYDTW